MNERQGRILVLRGFLISDDKKLDQGRVSVGSTLIIGRTSECGFIVDDTGASRHHVEIKLDPDGYTWRDLGSTNGTFLNGKAMRAGQLSDGDEFKIGSTVIRFETAEGDTIPNSDGKATLFGATLLDSLDDVDAETGETNTTDNLLRAVYTVMNDIAANYEPCALVDKILTTTMFAIGAQRGAVLFASDDGGALQPCPACGDVHSIRDGILEHSTTSEVRISQTIARRVLDEGESVLFQDTATDQEFNTAESIMSLNLRSIICVPLRGKMGALGILYIDSDRPKQQYTHEHMLLSTAVGNSAGLALENAKMHKDILDRQRINQEIEYAGIIQEGFLVKTWPTADARFEVFGETRPAKVVGGDFYDFVQPAHDRIGLLIADVSGKGVPAALAMAQLLAEFRVHVLHEESPAEVLRALNETMEKRSQRGMFCTMCYLTLDLTTGEAICANAGHHPIIRIGKNSVDEFGDPTGPPVGIMPDGPWENTTYTLTPGDSVLLYTDGIVEARGAQTKSDVDFDTASEYGLENLQQILKGLHGEHPENLVEEIIRDVHRYCEPALPHDDCTLIGMRYAG
jgi:serine phosphatase RsbU (regulator of sigma subunit)